MTVAADADQLYDSNEPQQQKREAEPDILTGHGFRPVYGHGHVGHGYGIRYGLGHGHHLGFGGHSHYLGHGGHALGHGHGLQYVSEYGFDTGHQYGIGIGHGLHGYGLGHAHVGHGLSLDHGVSHSAAVLPYGAHSYSPVHLLHKRSALPDPASEPEGKAAAKAGSNFHGNFGHDHSLGHSHDTGHVHEVGHSQKLTNAVAHGHAVGQASVHDHTVVHGHAVGRASLHSLTDGHAHGAGHVVGLGHTLGHVGLHGHGIGHGHTIGPGLGFGVSYPTHSHPVAVGHLGYSAVGPGVVNHEHPVSDHSVHVFNHAGGHAPTHGVTHALGHNLGNVLGQNLGYALGHSGFTNAAYTGPVYYLAYPTAHHG